MRCEDLIGINYVQGGRDPAIGLDCWGVAIVVFGRIGITVPDVFAGDDQLSVRIRQNTTGALDWIASLFGGWRRVESPIEGSAVVFQNVDGAAVHIGVMVGPFEFIHAMKRVGVVVNRIDRSPWSDRLLGAYVHNA